MSKLRKEIRVHSVPYKADHSINLWGDYDRLEQVLIREYVSEEDVIDTREWRLTKKRASGTLAILPLSEEEFKTAVGNYFMQQSAETSAELIYSQENPL